MWLLSVALTSAGALLCMVDTEMDLSVPAACCIWFGFSLLFVPD
jgi:hypothetical protein